MKYNVISKKLPKLTKHQINLIIQNYSPEVKALCQRETKSHFGMFYPTLGIFQPLMSSCAYRAKFTEVGLVVTMNGDLVKETI